MDKCTNKLPEAFIEKVKRIVPEQKLSDVLSAFCTKRPTSFRANTLKISADDLKTKLDALQILSQPVLWCTNAFTVPRDPYTTLGALMATDLYKEGCLYVQSLSSMIPALILNPKPGDKILDIAAAPGSKTTQMAAMMENLGEIIANDISTIRMYKLKANLAMQGVINTKTTSTPGQLIWQTYPEYFDASLVDAPCSLEGRIQCDDPKTYKDWSTKKTESLSKRQKFLLRSAISATKPGGVIVYATCTLSPEENEGVIDWILKKEKDAIEVEPIKIPGLISDEPIATWKNKIFDSRVKHTLRIYPSKTMEGFFVAKLRRLRSTIHQS